MKTFRVKKDGVFLPNMWTDENGLNETYYEPSFGDNYEVVITVEKEKLADISPRQIRLALLSQGVTESVVDNAIATLPGPTKEQAMIAWKYSTSFDRSIPIIEAIGTILGMNSDQLDALWIMGKSI